MTKILFVCHGNICRSPMAQFVLTDMAEKRGMARMILADSAATTCEEIGNPVYPPAVKKLREHGIDRVEHAARMVTLRDYAEFDVIIGMDRENIRDLKRIFGGDREGKVRLLLDYTDRRGEQVADPWYTRDFEAAWQDIEAGCRGLLDMLAAGK